VFRIDKEKSGLIPLAIIFKHFEMERNLIVDCLLELLKIEHGMTQLSLTVLTPAIAIVVY
jgi:hypothetical protein